MADIAAATATTPAAPPPSHPPHLWKDGSFGFADLLDIINPLQHLPVIGSIYRWATGDRPGDGARVIGDTIYGGPIGLVTGVLAVLTEDGEGHDLGEQAIAALIGPAEENAAPGETAAAAAEAPPTPATAAVVPDHPPIPLIRQAGTPAAARSDTASAFLARTAALRRQTTGGQGMPGAAVGNRVVPLQLTSGMPLPHPVLATARPAMPNVPPNVPVDISQKMLDALDKYMRMQQAREDRGGHVDVTP